MAEYINIKGQSIEVLASDPANPTLGQIWYNSTSNTLKGGGVTAAGAWATGNNLNTSRGYLAGAGTQTEALAFGGFTTTFSGATEEYDGTSWATSPGSLNTSRSSLAGAGTQTAALAFGGVDTFYTTATEEYDGTSWISNPTGLNTARDFLGSAGTQTAGLGFGGYAPPGGNQTAN
jgi:hypothetical protein